MPAVATGALSAPVPGLWRRLKLLSRDGSITGLSDAGLIGRLEEVGIPRHQHGVVYMLKRWQSARIPPDVALPLWLLREQENGHGLIYRRATNLVEESSPAIRYIQLAAAVGETRTSDPTLDRVVSWLLAQQLPDGSMPLVVAVGEGETGQTARTLRSLCQLGDPGLADQIASLRDNLLRTVRVCPDGAAWACYPHDQTVVTGATSLAVTALAELGVTGEPLTDAMLYLLASQDRRGGWAEVPGDRPTIQHTFQVVRAINTALLAGIVEATAADAALGRARAWFIASAGRRAPGTVLEHAFAVRLADQLGLLDHGRSEQLARQLSQRSRDFLDPAADMYADTEIAAIGLLEASRSIDQSHPEGAIWPWRWRLSHRTPRFLARGPYLYELLYGAIGTRWWVRFVDTLVRWRIIGHLAGLMLGGVTSIGIISDYVVNALSSDDGQRGALVVAAVGVLMSCWLLVKIAAQRSWWETVGTSLGSLVAAALLSVALDPFDSVFPVLVSLVGLRWLVTDVIAFTADSTGLLNKLLPNT